MVFYLSSFSPPSPPPSQRTVFPRLKRFPRDSFDIAFSDEVLEASPLKSVPASRSLLPVPLARFYYSVNWFSSARLVLRSLKSPRRIRSGRRKYAAVRAPPMRIDERERERREETGTRGREAPRRWSPLFTFRTNSISSGFCLIANATGKRKKWARRSAEAAVASSGTLGVQNFVLCFYTIH